MSWIKKICVCHSNLGSSQAIYRKCLNSWSPNSSEFGLLTSMTSNSLDFRHTQFNSFLTTLYVVKFKNWVQFSIMLWKLRSVPKRIPPSSFVGGVRSYTIYSWWLAARKIKFLLIASYMDRQHRDLWPSRTHFQLLRQQQPLNPTISHSFFSSGILVSSVYFVNLMLLAWC